MKGYLFFFGLILANAFYSSEGLADVSGLCSGCSATEKNNMALNWAASNITPTQAQQGIKLKFHVLDINEGSVTTFNVYKIYQYLPYLNPPTYVYTPASEEINTSRDVVAKAQLLYQELDTLSSDLHLIVIPKSVIDSAWEIPNCAYCANNLSDYLNNHPDVNTGFDNVQNTLNWLNIVDGKLNETWILTLSDGGKVYVNFNLIQKGQIVVVDIVKVIDANNNTVPMEPDLWGGQILKGSVESAYFQSIQHYLWRFGYMFKPLPNGTVTVEECRNPSDPPSSKPLCS